MKRPDATLCRKLSVKPLAYAIESAKDATGEAAEAINTALQIAHDDGPLASPHLESLLIDTRRVEEQLRRMYQAAEKDIARGGMPE